MQLFSPQKKKRRRNKHTANAEAFSTCFSQQQQHSEKDSDFSNDNKPRESQSEKKHVDEAGKSMAATPIDTRKEDFRQFRESLPVYPFRKQLIQAIRQTERVVLVVAETGSGKSTQIPAYALDIVESTWRRGQESRQPRSMIAVTQPRRVAAMTLAQRVAREHGSPVGRTIGYKVRFDQRISSTETRLVYVTDGMLLREAMLDPLLQKYGIIFLDEAHERSLQTDLLLGVVYRARQARAGTLRTLQVVLMSATLEVEPFIEFFGGKDSCQILHIPGRQYPVQVLYAAKPAEDYLMAAVSTILQIHLFEPDGDILTFLPGQEDIEELATLLRQYLEQVEQEHEQPQQRSDMDSNGGDLTLKGIKEHWTTDRVEVFQTRHRVGSDSENTSSKLVSGVLICLLYAALSPEAQLSAFVEKPPGCRRKIILATNIAETSITLPDIRYVVDCGKHKSRYVLPTGMESLQVQDISQAQARQRAGRAGRLQAGLCFRLYPEEAFEKLALTGIPEILRVNLGQVVLSLKSMGIKDPRSFEFVTRPDEANLIRAMELLNSLSALDDEMELTSYGKQLARLPLDPTFGHLLLQSSKYSCMDEMLTVVAILSAEYLLYRPSGEGLVAAKATAAHRRFVSHEGDFPTYLNVYAAWMAEAIYVPPQQGGWKLGKKLKKQRAETNTRPLMQHREWCQQNFVSGRALARASTIRSQLVTICSQPVEENGLGLDTTTSCGDDRLPFLECAAAGLFLQAAARIMEAESVDSSQGNSGKLPAGVARGRYRTKVEHETVSIHPSSTMFGRQPAPNCVVYTELVTTTKTYIRGVTQIREAWLERAVPTK